MYAVQNARRPGLAHDGVKAIQSHSLMLCKKHENKIDIFKKAPRLIMEYYSPSSTCAILILHLQCFCLSRNIGSVTPEIIHFHYLKKKKSGSKYPKMKYRIMETEAMSIFGKLDFEKS